jgi:mono/diheme cytochrome c family protein
MRCAIFRVCFLSLTVLTACAEPEAVSTGTKTSGLNPIVAAPTTPSGDATKGQTALTSSCFSCHGAGKSAHALNKNDVGTIDTAGSKSYHGSVATVFTVSGSDIKAFLATQ